MQLTQSSKNALFDGQLLNLNEATLQQVMQLPKISRKLAIQIVQERERLGRFRSFEELDHVKGIGPKTLERLKLSTHIR